MHRLMFPPVTVNVESCVMSSRFVAFTVYDIDRAREEEAARSRPMEKIATDDLAPGQQFALLILRRSDLSKLVVTKLWHSTVRPGRADFDSMITLNYVARDAQGKHALLPKGHYKANEIARKMGDELGIAIPEFRSQRYHKSRFGTRWNAMSQSDNW